MAAVDARSISEQYQPITEAEAELVVRRVETSGRPVEEVVAEVKGERVGLARFWDDDVAEQKRLAEESEEATAAEAQAKAAEATAATGIPAEVEVEVEEDEPEEEDDEERDNVLLDTTDDEFDEYLATTSIPAIVDELERLGEDERPTAAIRIRDHEIARGDAARSTLLGQVEPYAEEANS